MIFDTHTHYDDEAYDQDRDIVITGLRDGGVGRICNIGSTLKGARDSVMLARRYDFVIAAAGVHPDEVSELNEETFAELKELAADSRTAAIGEIGLDYHGYDIYEDKPDKETQKYWFLRQLELACELEKPVVIHSRNASEDTMEIMKEAKQRGLKNAVIHCYSYSKETAAAYLDMGFYLGIGGVLTYEGQKKLTKTVEFMPLDRILLETDCPYLTPVPIRKNRERNSSVYLSYVCDRIAEIKGLPREYIEQATWENACRFYGIVDKAAFV